MRAATPRERPRTVSAAESLLEAALHVHARGPEGFTVHAVVEESGRSLGSLYHHFGSFDGLAAAVYARSLGELLDAIIAAVLPCSNAKKGVEACVRAYLAFTREKPAAALFVHAQSYASFVPRHAETIAFARAPRLAKLLGWVRPHMEAGRIAKVPEPLFEMLVIGPVAETARRWLAKDPSLDLDEAARILPGRIWRAIEPDVSAPKRAR